MCLVALAIDQSRRFPLVIAANRDEAFARPTARLAWWSPGPDLPMILAGRDLQGGGTWMGLNAQGRLALVTNVRRPVEPDPDAPSRGLIVPGWLRGDQRADRFWMGVALSGHAPFNLIAADFRQGECFWASNEAPFPRRIERGVHGLSNAALDTPWPKVQALKAGLGSALEAAESVDRLAARLFEALANRQPADDADLPATGVGRDVERLLSPAFIRTPDGRYGTRCSTVLITERVHKRLTTHVFERSFTAGPGLALLRRASLKDWPPKYTDQANTNQNPDRPANAGAAAVELEPVADVELDVQPAGPPPTPKRQRVRSLLKPAKLR